MSTYTVRYERDERGWWIAQVPGLSGCHTQGRSIAQARERIREALALFVDDAEDAQLIDEVTLSGQLQQVVAVFAEERARAAATAAAAQAAGVELVRACSVAKLSFRDVGFVAGISHQRVQQLAQAANAAQHNVPAPRRRRVE